MWALIEHEGKLAVTLGWSPEQDNPVDHRDLWVGPYEWDAEYYGRFNQVRLVENGFFRCFDGVTYQDKNLYTEGWNHIHQTRPIKPPSRGGKSWNWRWSWGKWIKQY